jgi:hypothetical protein
MLISTNRLNSACSVLRERAEKKATRQRGSAALPLSITQKVSGPPKTNKADVGVCANDGDWLQEVCVGAETLLAYFAGVYSPGLSH